MFFLTREGRDIRLAGSNDLATWTKYEQNPLFDERSLAHDIAADDPKLAGRLYFAITREYATPSADIVLSPCARWNPPARERGEA